MSLTSYESKANEGKKQWPNNLFERLHIPDRGIYISCIRYDQDQGDSERPMVTTWIPIEGYLEIIHIDEREFSWLEEPFSGSTELEGLVLSANLRDEKQLHNGTYRTCDLSFENEDIHRTVRGGYRLCKLVEECNPSGTWKQVWSAGNTNYKFLLWYTAAEQRREYKVPAGVRIIGTPVAVAFDVVTSPVQAVFFLVWAISWRRGGS